MAVQSNGAGAVAVAEHPPVHLAAGLEHLAAFGVSRQLLGLVVEGFDLLETVKYSSATVRLAILAYTMVIRIER